MDTKTRIRAYAKQSGISAVGAFKSKSATAKFVTEKLSSAQQRRIRQKANGG